MNDIQYKIALSKIEGIGVTRIKTIWSELGSIEKIFTVSKKQLVNIPSIGEVTADKIIHSRQEALVFAEAELQFIKKNNIEIITFNDSTYPNRLKFCEDAPIVLFSKGSVNYNMPRVLSIVGTRQLTEYGLGIIKDLIYDLQQSNVLVVSGLAYGADTEVHRACVENEVPTVGVLAHGLDMLYPATNRGLAKKMMKNGALLTEFPTNTKPNRENFPSRNRIVAGIADATIVIESAEKGGSLITAEISNSYQRDVFAFPGAIDQEYSKGCNKLIKQQKALLIENSKDLFRALNWEQDQPKVNRQRKLFVDLSDEEHRLVQILLKNDATPEVLSRKAEMPLTVVQTHLLNLELQGVIRILPGHIYTIN